MALTKIKLDTMVTGNLPDANIPNDITIDTASAAPASGLTGNTLASGVTASSLTSVGTLTSLTLGGDLLVPQYIKHVGDTDCHIEFGTDEVKLRTGDSSRLIARNSDVELYSPLIATSATFSGTVRIPHDTTDSFRIGASDDLELWHNGTDSAVTNANTGKLYLWNYANGDTVIGSNNVESVVFTGANATFRGTGTFASQIKGADGSDSAPMYSFNSDTNTGMYLGTADTLRFATGGTERIEVQASQTKISTPLKVTSHITLDGVGHPILKLVGDASAGESTHIQLHRSNGHGFTIYDTGAALAFRSDTSSNDQILQLANSGQSATFYGDVTISKSSAKMTIFASNTGDHESLVFDRNTASNGDSQEIRWKLQGDSYPGGYILHEFADANNSTMAFGTRNSGTPTTAMSIDQNTRVSLTKLPHRVNTSQQNQTNLMSCFHWDHPDTDSVSYFDFNPVLDLGLPQTGGSFFLKISGWMLDRFFGLVTYRNNGGTGDISSGSDALDTIVNDGFSVGISRPSGNLIRIQVTGQHSNGHGWDMMAFTAPFVT